MTFSCFKMESFTLWLYPSLYLDIFIDIADKYYVHNLWNVLKYHCESWNIDEWIGKLSDSHRPTMVMMVVTVFRVLFALCVVCYLHHLYVYSKKNVLTTCSYRVLMHSTMCGSSGIQLSSQNHHIHTAVHVIRTLQFFGWHWSHRTTMNNDYDCVNGSWLVHIGH